jgi:hypothetical protein
MPDSLYETDALAWAEQQADLLRRLARGERLNETIDWANVIEEVESLGLSELRACRSLLRQAMVHLLKLYLEPDSQAKPHWIGEVARFLADARDAFAPSMRQRIDLPDLYADALYRLRISGGGQPDPHLPAACPFAPDDLLVREPDVEALVARLARDNLLGSDI